MQSMNKVLLIGRLAAKPEVKISKNGNHFARLRLATQRLKSPRDEGGQNPTSERRERYSTDWHTVFAWGVTAENCARYLNKGALVLVEGALTYWENAQDDVQTFKNAIRADEVHFLSYGTEADENSAGMENLDNFEPARNHNAVAHPA